jgi:hypothetical protein
MLDRVKLGMGEGGIEYRWEWVGVEKMNAEERAGGSGCERCIIWQW